MNGIAVAIETVTPDAAKAMLGANTHNRTLRKTLLTRYARDMKSGKWQPNGESIKFSTDGKLLDGQHRLAALVEANVEVPLLIVRGLAPEVQETVDTGSKRTVADILKLRGERSYLNLSASLSQALVLQEGWGKANGNYWPTTAEQLEYLTAHPHMRDSVNIAIRLARIYFLPGIAGALHHAFAHRDVSAADSFFYELNHGTGLKPTDGVYHLREAVIADHNASMSKFGSRRREMSRMQLAALTIKAWNATREFRPVASLRWVSTTETFPVIR